MNVIAALLLALTMQPGRRYTGWRWRTIAATRRALDDHRCTRCGATTGPLHVHHKRPVSAGGNYALWNLRSLCGPCHEAVHGWDIDGDGKVSRGGATRRSLWANLKVSRR